MSAPPSPALCPSCGQPLSSTLGFCPVCLLRGALAGGEANPGELSLGDALAAPAEGSPGARFEHYQLLTGPDGRPLELGRGAMGVTYRAVDLALRRPVALKVIAERCLGDETARRRFVREARLAARVRHPHVASVYHLGQKGGQYFYAMECVAGETLEARLRREGPLEAKLALDVAQIAMGIGKVRPEANGLLVAGAGPIPARPPARPRRKWCSRPAATRRSRC